MEPLFPAGEKGDRQTPKWLAVGSTFPELPKKRMQTSDFFVPDPPTAPTLCPKPKKKPKTHTSPSPSAPPCLSNYSEYEILDRDGLTQVLKWRLDFGCRDQVQFGALAGFEIPRYDRISNALIGKRSKETDSIVREMNILLGGKTDLLEKKTATRYYEAKWTSKPVDIVSGEDKKRDSPDSFLKRTRELNTALAKNPADVVAWLTLVEIQDTSITGKKAQSQITEKQLSILDKALNTLQGLASEAQLRALLRKVTTIARDDMNLSLWKYRDMYPASVAFWTYCLYFENCKFENFTVTKMRENFADALAELSERDENSFIAVKVWMVGELAKYEEMVTIFLYDEQTLVQIWDEERPRIGEKSAYNSELLTSSVQVPESVSLQNWLQAESECDNWLPLKASLQPSVSKCFPSAVVFSDDIRPAILSVPPLVSLEYKSTAVQLFLRHYRLEFVCSDCQTDAQLLQWGNLEESIDRRLSLKEDSQLKLQFLLNMIGEINSVFPLRDLQLWLVALEHSLGQQHWTKAVLGKSEDLAVWMEFARHSEKAWKGLKAKVDAAGGDARLVFYYHSFVRLVSTHNRDLREAVTELVLAVGGESDILPALCSAKAAYVRHSETHATLYGFSLSHTAAAVAMWLTYHRDGLGIAWDCFEATLASDFPQCVSDCRKMHAEWLCEEAGRLLRYHQRTTHVYVKTDLSERVARLLTLCPRNPVFLRMYLPFCGDVLQAVRNLVSVDEYHYAVLLAGLSAWQKDRVLREVRSASNFPEHPHSLVALWLESVKGPEAENRALTGLRKMPFCKSLYLSAFASSPRSEDVLAALNDKEIHLRLSPLL